MVNDNKHDDRSHVTSGTSYTPGYNSNTVIKIAGVGSFGCEIVRDLLEQNTEGTEFIAIDTDRVALELANAPNRIQLGWTRLRGWSAVGDPDLGRRVALDSRDDIKKTIQDTDLLFIIAGLGGGTGSGAAPVIAEVARDAGALTIAMVTMPLKIEGRNRQKNACKALESLGKIANVTIIVPDDFLSSLSRSFTGKVPSFQKIGEFFIHLIKYSVISMVYSIKRKTVENFRFEELKPLLAGTSYASIGYGKSIDSSVVATKMAIDSLKIENVKGVPKCFIVSVTMNNNFSLADAQKTMVLLDESLKLSESGKQIISTLVEDESNTDGYTVTVIAVNHTGESAFKPLVNF